MKKEFVPDSKCSAAMRSLRDDGPTTMSGLVARGVRVKSKVIRAALAAGMIRHTRRGWDLTQAGLESLKKGEGRESSKTSGQEQEKAVEQGVAEDAGTGRAS